MPPNKIKTVACVGGGVIGGGWAARFALFGRNVNVADPRPDAAQEATELALAAARRAWRRLTQAPLPQEGKIVFYDNAQEAAATADYVQESAPEREDLKRQTLAQIEETAGDEVVIASSTSGLLPSRLQAGMRRPQRLCVAHPFNPVYLLPLVEICGGKQTAPQTLQTAAALCQSVAMRPLTLRAEKDGFVADRLMEALWREALWLVDENIATTAEIDDAIRMGCGLRWAFMGPFLTFWLAGGKGGMRHFMAQFGDALKLPWTKLMDVPELNDELLEKIVSQTNAQTAGLTLPELMQKRDDCLTDVLQSLRANRFAAGQALAEGEQTLWAQGRAAAPAAIDAPLWLCEAQAPAAWMDYNQHMNESRYLQVFGDAADAFLRLIGAGADYVAAGKSFYTAETHICHLAQVRENDFIKVSTQLLAADEKRLHLFHTLHNATNGDEVAATGEQTLLHVSDNRACAADAPVQARINQILAAHKSLPRPAAAGRACNLKNKPPKPRRLGAP